MRTRAPSEGTRPFSQVAAADQGPFAAEQISSAGSWNERQSAAAQAASRISMAALPYPTTWGLGGELVTPDRIKNYCGARSKCSFGALAASRILTSASSTFSV